MRKTVAFILTVLLLLAVSAKSARAGTVTKWTDLGDSRYAQAMVFLAQIGILRGDGSGELLPDAPISRAEFCATIVRAVGLEDSPSLAGPKFPDVVGRYSWAAGVVSTAVSHGIVAGDDRGRFRPGDSVTVGEAATMLVRSLGRETEALRSSHPWPSNYLDICERLGIWTLSANTPTKQMTRGMAAEALYEAVDIADPRTQATMLDANGFRMVYGEVAGAVDSTLVASGSVSFVDGTVGAPDGIWDNVNLSSDAIIWALDRPTTLVGRNALCLINRMGRAVYVSPTMRARLGSIEHQGTIAQIALSDGTLYSVQNGSVEVSLNHGPATIRSLVAGDLLKVRVGLDGEVAAIDALREYSGALRAGVGHDYSLGEQQDALQLDASDDTVFTLNGGPADKEDIDMALLVSSDVSATLTWSTSRDTVARLDVTASGDPALTSQPVTALGHSDARQGDVRYVRLPGTNAGQDREFLLTPTATVMKDGVGSTFSQMQPGDLVSLRVGSDGTVSYIEVTEDTSAPKLSFGERTGDGSRYSFTIDGAIQPEELRVAVDGQSYYPGNGLNRLEFRYDYSNTTVTIVPALPFAKGTHELAVYARDYGDRELSVEAQFTVAPSSVLFASAEWQADATGTARQATVWLYFSFGGDDTLDASFAKDTSKWQFIDANPANGITRIAAVTHADYYVTLAFDGPVDSGSRLQASLRDTAGNAVTVDCAYNGR